MKKIELDKAERKLIRFCKGKHSYKWIGIVDTLEKLYNSIYRVKNPKGFKFVMINFMLETYLKIREDNRPLSRDILDIIHISLNKNFNREDEAPVNRVLVTLFSMIQGVSVNVQSKTGNRFFKRFNL